jgi:hypothetical protein
MNIKKFLPLKFGWFTLLGMMSLTASSAHAEISNEAAAQQMLNSGKWTIAITDVYGNPYFVDPYSIVKIRDNVFHINVAFPMFETNSLNYGRKINITRAIQTFEFDCGARRYAHIGWRYPGGFRPRKIIGGTAWNQLDQNIGNSQSGPQFTMPNYFARHVCPTASAEGSGIDAVGVGQGKSFAGKVIILNNTIYKSSRKNIVFSYLIAGGRSDTKSYVDCATGMVTSQGTSTSAAPYQGDPIYVDWMCKKLHPDTVVIEQDFNIPRQERPPEGTGNSSDALRAIESAKRQCSELGFKLGTEKFGNCVLKVSR